MEADPIMADEPAPETWFVRARGRILGPLTWPQLQALRERGQLARFDQVSRDRQGWMPADRLEALFPHAGAGGAFVAGQGAAPRGQGRAPAHESGEFLVIGEETPGSTAELRGVDLRAVASEPAAEEPTGWYYAEAGSPQGPIDYADLRRLAKENRIGPGTLYWRTGLETWIAGSDIPELNRLWPHDGPANPATTPAGPAPAQAARPEPSGPVPPLATVSLVSNLFCGIGNLAAVVVGAMALRQIARSNGTLGGRRQAVAGIALGVVGTILVALAFAWLTAGGER